MQNVYVQISKEYTKIKQVISDRGSVMGYANMADPLSEIATQLI
jgi:hypothetical protein